MVGMSSGWRGMGHGGVLGRKAMDPVVVMHTASYLSHFILACPVVQLSLDMYQLHSWHRSEETHWPSVGLYFLLISHRLPEQPPIIVFDIFLSGTEQMHALARWRTGLDRHNQQALASLSLSYLLPEPFLHGFNTFPN